MRQWVPLQLNNIAVDNPELAKELHKVNVWVAQASQSLTTNAIESGQQPAAVTSVTGGGANIIVKESGASISTAITTLDFGTGLDVSESPTGEANVTVDVTEVVGNIDHGDVAGLADDDHTQYILVAGTRVFTGAQAMGSNKITGLAVGSASGDALSHTLSSLDDMGAAGGDYAMSGNDLTGLGTVQGTGTLTMKDGTGAESLLLTSSQIVFRIASKSLITLTHSSNRSAWNVAEGRVFRFTFTSADINVGGETTWQIRSTVEKTSADFFTIENNGSHMLTIDYSGRTTLKHLANTFSAEHHAIDFDATALFTVDTTYSPQRFYRFQIPAMSIATTKTVALATTVYIEGAPTNAGAGTLTTALSLHVDDGETRLDGAVQFGAGQTVDLETVIATSATLGDDDYVILVDDDTAGSTVTITLPAAASHTGREYHIKKLGTTANVVVDGNASETIDGGTTATLSAQFESISIVCDGSNWHII